MKNLKKISLILALTLSICSLGSCGTVKKSGSDTDDSSSEIVINDRQPVTSKDKTILIENDDEEAEEASTVPVAEAPTEAESDNDTSMLSLGEVSGNVYTSKYNGLKITAPEGFEIINGKDLQSVMGTGAALTGLEDTMDLLSLITVNDAAVVNRSTGENITIVYENIAKTVPDPENYTVEEYFEGSEKAAEQSGIVLEAGEVSVTELGGQKFYTRKQSMKMPNYDVKMDSEVYIRKIDNYMLVISYSASLIGEDTAGDYKDWFSALE